MNGLGFELNNISLFRSCFDAISRIVDEAQLRIDYTGLKITGIDKSKITFLNLEFDNIFFDSFAGGSEGHDPVKFSLDVKEFMKILKKGKTSDRAEFSLDGSHLKISFIGESRKNFKLKLIHDDYLAPAAPDIDYPASFFVPYGVLKSGVKDCLDFTDKLIFKLSPHYLSISADSEFVDVYILYPLDNTLNTDYKACFNALKINDTLYADKFKTDVFVKMGDDLPITLNFETEEKDVRLSFILAPRIEAEE